MPIFFLIGSLSLSVFGTTIIPFERDVPRIGRFSWTTAVNNESLHYLNVYGSVTEGEFFWRGFDFSNIGPNEIVTTEPQDLNFANREFFFYSDDRSRRDTYLWVTDYNGSGNTSDYFESVLVFLPRENQMHIEVNGEQMNVTLTTGEEVIFSTKHKAIISGVMRDEALDMNPDRNTRKHPGLHYTGKGTIIRMNSNGSDPRLATHGRVLKEGLPPCTVKGSLFWTQEGFPKFRYVSDEEVYQVIKNYCGVKYLPY